MAGYDNKDVAGGGYAIGQVGTGDQVFGELNSRQVTYVLAVGDHVLEQVKLDNATEAYVVATARELQRQRRAPGPGANNGDRLQ